MIDASTFLYKRTKKFLTERSTIPYHSHNREFNEQNYQHGDKNEEENDGLVMRGYRESNDEERYDEIDDRNNNSDEDLMTDHEEHRLPSTLMKSNQPSELTYNGVKYIASKEPNNILQADPGVLRSMENGDIVGENEFDENGMDEPPPQDLDNDVMKEEDDVRNKELSTAPVENVKSQNIADVVRAILPEVVKTVAGEKEVLSDLTKRNSIPKTTTELPTTTHPPITRRPQTTTSTTETKHAEGNNDKTSQIDMIIKGLKALGLSAGETKNTQHEKRTSIGSPATTTTKTTTKSTTLEELHGTPPTPHIIGLHDPRQVRILCFGDSLTAGYNQHGKNYFPYCTPLQNILKYHSRLFVFTDAKGITGEMVHKQMTHRLPMVLGNATLPYDWVIILGGTNDILHVKNFGDDDEFLKQLENVWQPRILKDIEKLHEIAYEHGSHTMLLTVPENSIELWPEYKPLFMMRKKINEALRDFAYRSRGKTVLCDIAKKLPRHSLSPQQELVLWDDHLHLTQRGYTKMAGAVSDCLRPYLPNTDRK